jgi:hypothetical protein
MSHSKQIPQQSAAKIAPKKKTSFLAKATGLDELTSQLDRLNSQIETGASGLTQIISSYSSKIMAATSAMDIITAITSLVAASYELPTALKAFLILTGVYQIIKVAFQTIRMLFGAKLTSTFYEIFDTVESPVEATAQVLDLLSGLAYTAILKLMMPQKMIGVLTDFSRMSRIKIMDDMSWLGKLSNVIVLIPHYILKTTANLTRKAADSTQIEWLGRFSDISYDAAMRYYNWVDFIPNLKAERLIDQCKDCLVACKVTAELHSPARFDEVTDLVTQMVEMSDSYATLQTKAPKEFEEVYSQIAALRDTMISLQYMIKQTPVALVICGAPHTGKTYLCDQLVANISSHRDNTVYYYNPSTNANVKPFMDGYNQELVLVHSEAGTTSGMNDFAQYLRIIDSTPSKADTANANKKDKTYLVPRLILATTNQDVVNKRITIPKDCYVDPEAIYRRFIAVVPEGEQYITIKGQRKSVASHFGIHEYDEKQQIYKKHSVYQADDIKGIMTYIVGKMEHERLAYMDRLKQKNVAQVDMPSFLNQEVSFIKQSGRYRVATTTPPPVVTSSDQQQVDMRPTDFYLVAEDGKITREPLMTSIDELVRVSKANHIFVNGTTDPSEEPVGEIVVTKTKESWDKYIKQITSQYLSKISEQLVSFIDVMRAGFYALAEFAKDHKKEILIISVLLGAITLLVGVASFVIRNQQKKEKMEKFLHVKTWPTRQRKLTAMEFMAQAGEVELTSQLESISKNVFSIQVTTGTKTKFGTGIMLASRHMLCNIHTITNHLGEIPEEVFVKATKGGCVKFENHMVIKHTEINEDAVLLTFKHPVVDKFRKLIFPKTTTSKEYFLVTPDQIIPVGQPDLTTYIGVYYRYKGKDFVVPRDSIQYPYEQAGWCGSPVVSSEGFLYGWHVATYQGLGFARPIRNVVRKIIVDTPEFNVDIIVDEKAPEIQAATPVRSKQYYHVPIGMDDLQETQMRANMPSEHYLDGAPRAPANITKENYEKGQAKNFVVADKVLDMEAAKFAQLAVRRLIQKATLGKIMKPLSNKEVVSGRAKNSKVVSSCYLINEINGDASAGIPYKGLVRDHVNFETGELSKDVMDNIQRVVDGFNNKIKDPKAVIFKDTPKSEVRDNSEKVRIFAAGPLHYTLMLRKVFGELIECFVTHRDETGVMIGMNATSKEWQLLTNHLMERPNIFAGDYPFWDGGMDKMAQELINEEMAFVCEDPEFALYLLSFLGEVMRVGGWKAYLTSHSVPSGHGLTALYNSLVNFFYIAYAWYLLVGKYRGVDVEAAIIHFFTEVYAVFYGDDNVVTVSSTIKGRFNALTYTEVMKSIGVNYSKENKEPHDKAFYPLADITFLKRGFRYHDELKSVTGPLNLRTINSMTDWMRLTVTTPSEIEVVNAKMNSVQRELYLHGIGTYASKWPTYKNTYETTYGTRFTQELAEQDIITLYHSGNFHVDTSPSLMSTLKHSLRKNHN